MFSALVFAPGCKKDEGGACFSKSECAEGLACVGDALSRCEKCSDLTQCTGGGQCTAKDGACVATSTADCKKSASCKENGPCTAKGDVCVVGSDADCQQSVACAKEHFCVAKGNNCVVGEANKKGADNATANEAPVAKLARSARDAEQPK